VAELAKDAQSEDATRVPAPRTETTGRDSRTTLEHLENRVAQLERLAWGSWDDRVALVDCDPELRRLATTAETGQQLTARLASPEIRSACERAIATWDEWHRRNREVLGTAVAASHTIAITSADQRGRAHAVAAFRETRNELAELAAQRHGYLNAAIYARRQLDQDELVRDQHQPEIDAGHDAWVTLLARLRTRLAAAIERGEPVPGWLVLAIGPPTAGSSARWRDFASDLLAYRITYGVTGSTESLGRAPTSEHSPRRRRWYAELRQRLKAWQETSR
jgi:hypothetical protein